MQEVKVWVSEKKVAGAIPSEVDGVFASLQAGLAAIEQEFRRVVSRDRDRWEQRKLAMEKMAALEQMALSVVAGSIVSTVESMRARIRRMEKQADFADSGRSLVLSCWGKGLNGRAWIRRREDDSIVIELSLDDKERKCLGVRQDYATAKSFDAAYGRTLEKKSEIDAELEAMMARYLEGLAEGDSCATDLKESSA
jgi:hypothetical protein